MRVQIDGASTEAAEHKPKGGARKPAKNDSTASRGRQYAKADAAKPTSGPRDEVLPVVMPACRQKQGCLLRASVLGPPTTTAVSP